MSLFRRKPVEVEAVKFFNNIGEIIEFCCGDASIGFIDANGDMTLQIATLEGKLTATKGDWIIKGVKGEFYPCKPDNFNLLYEPLTV